MELENKWKAYEVAKQNIDAVDGTEYEKEIKKIINELEV